MPLGPAVETWRPFSLPRAAQLLEVDPARGLALWREATPGGLFLRETSLATGAGRDRLALNAHLAAIDWGRAMLIDYRSEDGQALKAAVILPPGYREGRRYPTIVWVYPGYRVRDLNTYFLDPYMAGFYNLRLYAARGYVVLIPSMPHSGAGQGGDFLADLSKGVLPAVDRMVAARHRRFRPRRRHGPELWRLCRLRTGDAEHALPAAVAMAGITDFTGFTRNSPRAPAAIPASSMRNPIIGRSSKPGSCAWA